MPKARVIHYNPPETMRMYRGRTRCGRRLAFFSHTTDAKDVTCDKCHQLIAIDMSKGVRL